MNIRDFSSQFTAYVFTTDVDQGAGIKVQLSQAGYDAYFIQDIEQLEDRLKENPPHVLIFSTSSLGGALSDFVTHVQKINDEIRFIAISDLGQFDILSQYNVFGFVDIVSADIVSLESRCVWAMDRACEKLYLTYQNEQLYDDLKKTASHGEQAKTDALVALQQKHDDQITASKVGPSISMRLADYKSAQSKEDMVQRFLNNISGSMCIFFKFLPSVRSFVATHANGIGSAQIQGVGCQLESNEMKDLNSQFSMGVVPPRFETMLQEAFSLNPPKALPLYAHNNLEGVFVYSGSLERLATTQLTEEFALFNVCYAHLFLEKKVDALEVQDFVTELYNRNYYLKTLADEVSRARRLQKPISVVKIAMDDVYEIESSLGEAVKDELLKSLASVIAKTSRTNDISCRTAANEMAMILPHCSKKGAALRSERLRRIIEGTSFLDNGMKISISLGVSEYPSLCDSAKSLDESATKALIHIADKGGNKICLYKAPDSYKPEFEIPAE